MTNNNESALYMPSHSEWGLLNSLKHQQYQQAVKLQKYLDFQKKQKFRSQLDKQLRIKSTSFMTQKQADKAYSQFIAQKAKIQEEKQKNLKLYKYNLRRSMEIDNQRNLQEQKVMRSSRQYTPNPQELKYVIGYRDNRLSSRQEQQKKKKIMKELDQQVQQRNQMKRRQKMQDINDFYKSLQEQDHMAKSQSLSRNRKFKQNQQVYNYYSDLYKKRQQENKNLEYSIVDKSMEKKKQNQNLVKRQKQQNQRRIKKQIKQVLDQQVSLHKIQTQRQKQPKPQQISYSYFGSMFGPKGYGNYDKKQYNQYLKKQMQTQRLNKKKLQFMNEKQYLLNMNLINKAVTGNYVNQRYEDYSLLNVGQKLKLDSKQGQNLLKYNNYGKQIYQNPQNMSNENKKLHQRVDKDIINRNLNQLLKSHSDSKSQRAKSIMEGQKRGSIGISLG